jgi:hypothetical protein
VFEGTPEPGRDERWRRQLIASLVFGVSQILVGASFADSGKPAGPWLCVIGFACIIFNVLAYRRRPRD